MNSETGAISDDTRIKAALPTIKHLIANEAKIILCSHLGRPKGTVNSRYSLVPVAQHLSQLLDQDVVLSEYYEGRALDFEIKKMKPGEIMMLENIRFFPGEEENSPQFAFKLSKLCDHYVNDAFGVCHRKHASTFELPKLFNEEKSAGFLLEAEIKALSKLNNSFKAPFLAILGGAKVSDKISVLDTLTRKADTVLIGGAMAHTFSLARGYSVGDSMVEENKVKLALKIIERAQENKCELIFPIDYVYAKSLNDEALTSLDSHIPEKHSAFDIGPKTRKLFEQKILSAQTIFWNGPMGVFEKKPFHKGTEAIAQSIAQSAADFKVCGGGDSVSAVKQLQLEQSFHHVSTGGGASLEMIEGKELPGIESLKCFKNRG